MSIICWDGKTLAADKQATCEALRTTVTKIRRVKDCLIAWIGSMSTGQIMANWYEAGADLEKYPICQRDKDDWSRLIVVKPRGLVVVYEQWPTGFHPEDKFLAFGSGRDYAMGAMAMGADARRAVEIASHFCTSCGMGVDALTLEPA